jgi:hypothetical protein
MLVVGIDVASEVHQVAVIDETESVVVKPTPFAEDAAGFRSCLSFWREPAHGVAETCPWRWGARSQSARW